MFYIVLQENSGLNPENAIRGQIEAFQNVGGLIS